MTKAILGATTQLGKGDVYPDPTVYTPVLEIYNMGEITRNREFVDVTSHDLTNFDREFISGLNVPTTLAIEANYIANQYEEMLTLYNSGIEWGYEISYPDGAKHVFGAIVVDLSLRVPLAEQMTHALTLQVVGPIVYSLPPESFMNKSIDSNYSDSGSKILG